jgi:DNA-binding MarR family transcriptional regulator
MFASVSDVRCSNRWLAYLCPVAVLALRASPSQQRHHIPHPLPGLRAEVQAFFAMHRLVGYHIRRVQLTLFKRFEKDLDSQTTPAVLHMLLLIDENPCVTMAKIAAAHGIDRASLAPAIKRMHRLGWIERVRSPSDKRALMLRCTERGRALALATLARARAIEAELLTELSAAEGQQLLALLKRVARRSQSAAKSTRNTPRAAAQHADRPEPGVGVEAHVRERACDAPQFVGSEG